MSELNDPRVLFAAERTLMAWTRTSLTLLAFGFMVERFGLFVRMFAYHGLENQHQGYSYWIGIAFMLLGTLAASSSVLQYRRVIGTLNPGEIPHGYTINTGVYLNIAVAILGIMLTIFLIFDIHV